MNRSPQECPELIALKLRDRLPGRIEKIFRVQRRVAKVFVEAAVELPAAATGRDQHLRPAVASELGAVTAGLDLELLYELHRRAHHDPVDKPVVVVHSVQKKIIGRLASAVEVKTAGALRR